MTKVRSCIIDQKYTLGEQLGKGSVGTVLIGVQNDTGKSVAIKLIFKNRFNLDQHQDIQNEIDHLKQVQNDHIIPIIQYNYDKIQCCLWIVMPLCKQSLRQYMNKKKIFTSKEIKSFLVQMVSAFIELDKKKLMHLDLKPENILITNYHGVTPHYVLCDFGCSSKSEKSIFLDYQNKAFGTKGYLALDNHFKNSKQKLRSSADVWSLGAILYQMIFKKLPFDSIKRQQLNFQKLQKWHKNELKKSLYRDKQRQKQLLNLIYAMLQPVPSKRINWHEIKDELINNMKVQIYQFFNINQIIFCLNTLFKLINSFGQALVLQKRRKKKPFWNNNQQLISNIILSILSFAQQLGQKIIKTQAYRWELVFNGFKTIFMIQLQKILQLKNNNNFIQFNPQEQQLVVNLENFVNRFSEQSKNTKALIFIDKFSRQLAEALSKNLDLLSNIYIFKDSFLLMNQIK